VPTAVEGFFISWASKMDAQKNACHIKLHKCRIHRVGKLKSLVRIKNRKTVKCVRSLDPSGGQAAGNILARNFN
jgi:hypothetical protein